jgi:hypothetical protein
LYTLWGLWNCYYTSKIRSYLIRKAAPYCDWYPSNLQFQARILPKIQPMDLAVSICRPI